MKLTIVILLALALSGCVSASRFALKDRALAGMAISSGDVAAENAHLRLLLEDYDKELTDMTAERDALFEALASYRTKL